MLAITPVTVHTEHRPPLEISSYCIAVARLHHDSRSQSGLNCGLRAIRDSTQFSQENDLNPTLIDDKNAKS